jgi:hypothetical protein
MLKSLGPGLRRDDVLSYLCTLSGKLFSDNSALLQGWPQSLVIMVAISYLHTR